MFEICTYVLIPQNTNNMKLNVAFFIKLRKSFMLLSNIQGAAGRSSVQ